MKIWHHLAEILRCKIPKSKRSVCLSLSMSIPKTEIVEHASRLKLSELLILQLLKLKNIKYLFLDQPKERMTKLPGLNLGVMKIDHTPGSKLVNNIKKRFKREISDIPLMVSEQTGQKLKHLVQNAENPWEKAYCGRDECWIWYTSKEGSYEKCWTRNGTCILTVKDVKKIKSLYIGELKNHCISARQHADSLRLRKMDGILHNHYLLDHEGELMMTMDFKIKLTGMYQNCLIRQTAEGALLMYQYQTIDWNVLFVNQMFISIFVL